MIIFRFLFKKISTSFCATYFFTLPILILLDYLIAHDEHMSAIDIHYYANLIFTSWDILSCFAFTVSLVYVICSLRQNNETIAITTSGMTKTKIVTPFFLFAVILTAISYINYEVIIPNIGNVETLNFVNKHKKAPSRDFIVCLLDNNGKVIYQENEGVKHDLFWIPSKTKIWHCNFVSESNGKLIGHEIDKFEKTDEKTFERVDHMQTYHLPFTLSNTVNGMDDYEKMPITRLIRTINNKHLNIHFDMGCIMTSLCYKLVIPFFYLIITTLFASQIFCKKRCLQPMFLYMVSIISFIILFAIVKTAVILGENYMVSPLITLVATPLFIETWLISRLCLA